MAMGRSRSNADTRDLIAALRMCQLSAFSRRQANEARRLASEHAWRGWLGRWRQRARLKAWYPLVGFGRAQACEEEGTDDLHDVVYVGCMYMVREGRAQARGEGE